ncbi:precorrin-3B C(17)-methyltransferase [Brevibacillus laterosporus]|uniref:precorrin-3B C(17)-methyltransferase n=1 Tax=Brevibacillus laterosporus TaxID=1465 RepID=UPI00264FB5A7|nr:precorrin-3B C(17)-methyltransferase [Brevibacillus laterosporus]MDN9008701.1 precorrin-3B C(17)-methyltransferase [Brevibacillus laterosporus]MDO0939787.1 precorrin-3B C(17)-methyltransferase [Brevibacillus laterosporus]
MEKGKILLIGFGPGHHDHITHRAKEAILECEVIIGYNTYVDLIRELISDKSVVRTGMTEEVSRAQEAVRLAELGKVVGVISSGDAGVYGMAGLVYEVLVEKGWTESAGVKVEVVPGISSIQSCASLLGAPIMHDACTISLSDHLTPWETIAKRVEAAASADFVIALYNPRSGRRTRQIVETQQILLKYRSPKTPVGIVKSAYRDREHVVITTLEDMLQHEIGMLTTVIIGNSTTFVYDQKIITPRGYQRKYTLNRMEQPLKPHERLQEKAEPWALHSQPQSGNPVSESSSVQEAAVATSPQATIQEAQVSDSAPSAAMEALSNPRQFSGEVEQNSFQAESFQAPKQAVKAFQLAMEALACVDEKTALELNQGITPPPRPFSGVVDILELGVSPGVARKNFTSEQMRLLADLTKDGGEMMYSIEHQIILRLPQVDPEQVTQQLRAVGFQLFPIGASVQVKACDFCDLEKDESIPVAEELGRRLDGLAVPKDLKIGFNGCGMACYGAVMEDIGLVYRRGAYDVFLGGKRIGRNAHPGQRIAEGVPEDQIIGLVERIVDEYKAKGHIEERFHKFFKRTGQVLEYRYQEFVAPLQIEEPCGD